MSSASSPSHVVHRIMTFLFSSFIGSVFLAGLMVTGPILVHFFWYEKNPTEHRRYVLDNVEAWLFWAAANLLVSWCLGLLIDLVPVVVLGIISLGWGHVSEQVKNTSQLYNSVKGTLKPPFYAASGWVSWIIIFQTIYKLYDSDDESLSKASYTPRVCITLCASISPADFILALPSRPVFLLLGLGRQCAADVVSCDRLCISSHRVQRTFGSRSRSIASH